MPSGYFKKTSQDLRNASPGAMCIRMHGVDSEMRGGAFGAATKCMHYIINFI